MKFCCIADEETVRGFRLAGIAGRVAANAQEAARFLELALAQADSGIIVITESLADGIREQVETIRLERDRPLIVEIPGPEGWRPGRKGLRQLVQEAVGIPMT